MSLTLPRAAHEPRVEAPLGFAVRVLDWDTKHFGRKMAAIARTGNGNADRAALAADLGRAVAFAAAEGCEHVMLRVPAEHLELASAAERCGLRLVDVAVDTCVTNLDRRPIALTHVRPFEPRDLEALRNIASSAFEMSRFAADPFFTADEVAGLYRQWVSNLCAGLAKAVLVVEAADEVAGFVSCAVQSDGTGRIPLIATSDDHRRQGVGRALIDASLAWFASAGVVTAWVRTQAANVAALALYQRAGFRVTSCELTYTAILRPETRG